MWKMSFLSFSSLTFKTTLSLKQAFSMKKKSKKIEEHQTNFSSEEKVMKNGKLIKMKI